MVNEPGIYKCLVSATCVEKGPRKHLVKKFQAKSVINFTRLVNNRPRCCLKKGVKLRIILLSTPVYYDT